MLFKYLQKSILLGALLVNCASSVLGMQPEEKPKKLQPVLPSAQEVWKGSYFALLPRELRDRLCKYLIKSHYLHALNYWLYSTRDHQEKQIMLYGEHLICDPTGRYFLAWDDRGIQWVDGNAGYGSGDWKKAFSQNRANVQRAFFDAQSKRIAVVTADRTISFYDVEDGSWINSFINKEFTSCCFNPHNNDEIFYAHGQEMHRSNIHDGWITLKRTKSNILLCAYDSKGNYLARVAEDKTCKLWNLKTNQLLLTVTDIEQPDSLSFQAHDTLLVITTHLGKVLVIDVPNAKIKYNWDFPRQIDKCTNVSFDSTGDRFLVEYERYVNIYDRCNNVLGSYTKESNRNYTWGNMGAFFAPSDDVIVMSRGHNRWEIQSVSNHQVRMFFAHEITLEQAAFLYQAYQAVQDKQPFEIYDNGTHESLFNSLPKPLQSSIKSKLVSKGAQIKHLASDLFSKIKK